MVASVLVALILYFREFHSRPYQILKNYWLNSEQDQQLQGSDLSDENRPVSK